MFSNLLKTATVLSLFSILSLSGCDSRLGEEPPPPASQEFSGTQCLSDAKPVVKDFIRGAAKTEDVESTWDCISGAVEKFKRYVRGRSADRYTTQEIATFLESNFLDRSADQKISLELQVEFMKIKQVFIGGSQDYVTRAEIDKLISLFKNLRQITVGLNPYMEILSQNWALSKSKDFENDVRHFEEANQEIQTAARALAASIEANSMEYRLSDFVNLTEELNEFFGENWQFPKSIAKYMPVVKKVKKALAGGDENLITASEWRRFLNLGARGYIQYLRYYYFIQSVPETGAGYRLSFLSRTAEDVLSVFQDLVAQKPEGIVSRDEITDLLRTLQVVWPDFKVTDKLVLELMKVKHLFFGGSVDSFTTTDFGTARLKVSRIKTLVERFLPYYSVYGGNWESDIYDPEESQRFFMESQFVLEATVREAGLLFEGSYDLQDLTHLFEEIEFLYPADDGSGIAVTIEKYLPLVIDLKNMVLGGNDSSLRKANWSVLLGFAARFYSDYLYYDYFLKGQSLEKPINLSYLSVLINQTLNIARDLLGSKVNGPAFSRAELNQLAQHFVKLDILPKRLTPEAIDQVVGVVLNNVLVLPEQRIDGYAPNSLNLSSLEVLRQEAQVWLDSEIFMARVTETWKPGDGYYAADLLTVLKQAQEDMATSPALHKGLREFVLSVQSPVPLTVDADGRLIISNIFQQLYTAKSLRQLNMNRAIARVLIRSFVNDKERIANYIGATLPEVQTAFITLKPVLVELKLIEEKNMTFASSRFREANMFVPHADGNTLGSYVEVADLVGMIWSGLRLNEQFNAQFNSKNLREVENTKQCLIDGVPVTAETVLSLSCARALYVNATSEVMRGTPEFLRYMGKISKDEVALYLNNVFKAAGYVPNSKSTVRMGDISLTPHVIQYIEMIYARFDKNKDGFISTKDSYDAFPVFKGILMELASEQLRDGTLKESELLDLFTFILRYGKPPETLLEKIRFGLNWRGKPEKWDVWADRGQLAAILGYIADQVAKTSNLKFPPLSNQGPAVIPVVQQSQ